MAPIIETSEDPSREQASNNSAGGPGVWGAGTGGRAVVGVDSAGGDGVYGEGRRSLKR